MKAVVYRKYGPPMEVLKYTETDKPVQKDDEVLIKVHASSVNKGDSLTVQGKPFLIRIMMGLFKPKNIIPGIDVAGTVESTGKDITDFKPGDEVFGDMYKSGMGAYAEYVCAKTDALVHKPEGTSFEEAATLPVAAITALQAARDKAGIKTGQTVLINGASGSVGTFTVQIVKALGAEVTAVCSTHNLESAWKNGADYVIDYKKEDFTKNGKQYDCILGVNGYQPLKAYKNSLNEGGIYVCVGGSGAQIMESMVKAPFLSAKNKKLMNMGVAQANREDLLFLNKLLESGKLKPVVEKEFPLEETPEAVQYIAEGHAKGKTVISVLK
jgi:NADPH:quinone reductase-like Zn-dependent oxidoreductase